MTPFIPSGRYWISTRNQPFTLSDGTTIVVPKGFPTDGHSIPPIFLPWIHPHGGDMYAAMLHDYLYRYKIGTRKQADLEYLYQMEQLGTSLFRRYAFYYFVRTFAWVYW